MVVVVVVLVGAKKEEARKRTQFKGHASKAQFAEVGTEGAPVPTAVSNVVLVLVSTAVVAEE